MRIQELAEEFTLFQQRIDNNIEEIRLQATDTQNQISLSLMEHVNHVALAIECLKKNQIFVKASKCTFGVDTVDYLGHVVSKEGVFPDPKKIEAMMQWPVPKYLKQLCGFLGTTRYHHRFVKGYASLALPLTDLLKSSKAFHWTEAAMEAFQNLKESMTSTHILALPNFAGRFMVETDASNTGIGVMLLQNDKPLSFFNKKLGIRM
ncbi:uncharacterized mitochondrial protein AtMg00860-like [Gastrolobium bilobum]|uniref:uncharacterized mitochondrial protein AtMg00860-like n=1 Tax=Gastrolobium bilobum TaxID=150636 RepID=UPI002AAF7E5D|nr:uncharacterized mitochondrial protein AtMg00860-like [Gastrolobium bilobum]